MSDRPPKRLAIAVSKYEIGVIKWNQDDPVVLTGGTHEDHAVVVYRQLELLGEDWTPLTRGQIENDLNKRLPPRDDHRGWMVEDIDTVLVFLSLEALYGRETEMRVAPIQKALLWQIPAAKLVYVTSATVDIARVWLRSLNHDRAHIMSVSDRHGATTLMRLVEEFIRDGEIQARRSP